MTEPANSSSGRGVAAAWRWWAIAALLAVGAVRLLAICLHDPVLGYANNWDFIRIAGCYGLWPEEQSGGELSADTKDAPRRSYITTDDRPACLPSSDGLLVGLPVALDRLGLAGEAGRLDLREIGVVRAVIVSLYVGCLLLLAGRTQPRLAIMLAISFALVITDPAVALGLNTMYTEFGSIVFCFIALGFGWLAGLDRAPGWWVIALWVLSLGLFAFSREQNSLLAMLLPLTPLLFGRPSRRLWLGMAAGLLAAVVGVVGLSVVRDEASAGLRRAIRLANLTDTMLGAVLPAASDRARALEVLGLPEHCTEGIGITWYHPGVQDEHPCPEVESTSRVRLVRLFVEQPGAFLELILGAVRESRPWILDYLGHVEGRPWAAASSESAWAVLSWSSVASCLDDAEYAGAVMGLMLGWLPLLVVVAARGRRRPREGRLFPIMLLGCSLVAAYSVVSSVLGDGYWELAKHAHLLQVAAPMAVVTAGLWLLTALIGRVSRR